MKNFTDLSRRTSAIVAICAMVFSYISPAFAASPSLSLSGGGTGNGTVTSADGFINCTITAGVTSGACAHTYGANFSTVLTASASVGSTFSGWSGGCTGTGTCSASANGNNTFSVVATFNPNDTTPPTINSITSVAGDTSAPYYDTTDDSSTAIVFTSSDPDDSVSACKWNTTDVAYDSMANTCASTSSCTLNLSGNGAKTVYMRCMDSHGVKATSSYALNYTIDSTAPTGSFTINNNDTYATSTSATLNFSGVSSDVSILEVRNGTVGSFQAPVPYANAYSYTLPAGDGAKTVSVRFTDAAGNQSVGVISDSIILETTVPTVSSVDSDGQTYSSLTVSPHTIKVTFSEDSANTPTISVNGSGQTVNNCADADAKTFCFDYAVPATTEATETITIAGATDVAGNTMVINNTHTFLVDTAGPVLVGLNNQTVEATSPAGAVATFTVTATDASPASPVVTCVPASGSTFVFGTTPVSCSATDTAGNTSNGGFNVTVQDTTKPVITLNGSNPVTVQVFGTYTESGANVTDNYYTGLSATISGLVDTNTVGAYPVHYDVTDGSGNSAVQMSRTVNVVDQEKPSTADNVPAAWQTADTTITLTCTDNVSCSKSYYTTDGNDPTVLSSYVNVASSWQFVVSTEGQFVIKYFSEDMSSNQESVKTATNILKIDKTLPTATPVSISSNNSNSSTLAKAGDTITVSFTTSETLGGLPAVTIAGKSAVVTNVGNNYTAAYTLTATETQGVAAITIDFTDIAGNAATQVTATTDASNVTIDTVAPAPLTVMRPSDNEVIETATSNSEGLCETGATVAISGTALQTNPTITTCAGGQFLTPITFTPASLDTTFNLTFIESDAAGNTTTKTISNIHYITKVVTGGGSGPVWTDFTPPNEQGLPAPSNNQPTENPSPAQSPSQESPSNPTPETQTPAPATEESTPANPQGENITPTEGLTENNIIPEETNNEGTPTEGNASTSSEGGTPATGGETFSPSNATLDIGGGVTPPAPAEGAPAQNTTEESTPEDIGGGVTPPEGDGNATLVWTLLGIVALLNGWWFFATRGKVPPVGRN